MKITADLDLRSGFGAVRDQGPRPTCLAFAASAAHERKLSIAEYLSTEYLFFRAVQRSHCDPKRGLTVAALTAALAVDGQPMDTEWPYDKQPPGPGWSAPVIHGPLFKASIAFSDGTVAQVRQALLGGTPVVLIVAITMAFFRPDAEGVVRLQTGDRPTGGHHAVLALGSGSSKDGQHILVRNSWGHKWGVDGHAWVSDAYLAAQLRQTGILQ